jgi:Mg2+-importing ATPase
MAGETTVTGEAARQGEATAVRGLTSQEAEERLAEYGTNEPAPLRRRSALAQFVLLFTSPLVIILLLAAVVAAFLGEVVDAAIIIAIVLVGNAINFVQTYRSQLAVERLRARVAPTATVLRDGAWQEIPRQVVVPGDVVRLSAGDLVPADARLLASRDLFVQQAALTGESLPTEKEAQAAGAQEGQGPEARHLVFLGTSVVSGTATALVLATGPRTCFGDIAARLAARPEETEFERGLRRFGMLILRVVFFLVLFILGISIALHRNAFESLLFAVALAVGLTPEFLPMITSVTLARGAVRMAHRKVIVKNLASIQNFGSIDVFCSDKTGTITSGNMTVDRAIDCRAQPSERAFLLAYLNSKFESGIRSPLDAAILKRECPAARPYEKRDEIPFDFERRRVSIVVAKDGEHLLITKGAPESILPLAAAYGAGEQTHAIDAAAQEAAKKTYEELSRQGFRVLAVAYRSVEARPRYAVADEAELVLAGFVGFSDPLLADSAEALEDLRADGVQVKILTGDNELVTAHVCQSIGLDPRQMVLGRELDRMTDQALARVAEDTSVFARVSPKQKHRIIQALMRHGHVVGYMGDGINDAPSLHSADVGISVPTAVDVARDAADIIFVEPGLRVLHSGILEGRRASGNVMKYLLMGTSSNFGNMLSMAAASAFLPFLPMLPTQILLNNFLYDLAQITIPTDNVDEEYIQSPQRWDVRLIRNFMLFIGPISSLYDFLTFFVLLSIFHASEPLFHTGWFVESLATQTLVLFVIRTMRNPLCSRPSRALAATVCAVVLVGLLLPFTGLARPLGFTPLPSHYFVFLVVATLTYLMLVELGKRALMRGLHRAASLPAW